VPTLESLGYGAAAAGMPFVGGETEALRMMAGFLADKQRTASFEKPKTSPACLHPQVRC